MVMEQFALCYCCMFSLGISYSCFLLEGSARLGISNLGKPRNAVSLGSWCLWGAELPCCFLQEALQLLMESAQAFPSRRRPACC